MLIRILLRWLISALAVWIAAAILPGVHVTGGFWTYLWLALLLGVVNAILGTFLLIITLPLTIITLGLFAIVVNAIVFAATAGLSSHLQVDNFWYDILAALVISIVTTVLGLLIPERRHSHPVDPMTA